MSLTAVLVQVQPAVGAKLKMGMERCSNGYKAYAALVLEQELFQQVPAS
jgi:hypothetical protein